MVSPCLNLCKANWFKNTGSICRKTPTPPCENTAFISLAASLDDSPRKPLAALYAAGPKGLPTQNMDLSCAKFNDAAVQYQERENYRAFHTHVAIRTALR
jgi:hypothetical protein